MSTLDLMARRRALGLDRRALAAAAAIGEQAVVRAERDGDGAVADLNALLATLDRLEASAERRRHFRDVAAAAPAESRRRPTSVMEALRQFHAAGVAVAADIVGVAAAEPLVIIVGTSRVGAQIIAWSMATGTPADGLCFRIDITGGGVDAALDALLVGGQLARVVRGGAIIPPLRTLRVAEPAIGARRDGGGRVNLLIRAEPPPAPVVTATTSPSKSAKPARRKPAPMETV